MWENIVVNGVKGGKEYLVVHGLNERQVDGASIVDMGGAWSEVAKRIGGE